MDNDITTLFPNGLRIIVVDNDEQSLHDLVQKLITFRYKVTACSKASSALKVLKNTDERIDLVITEVRMPDIDGFSLLQHVKSEFNIPVIREHDLAVECLVAGATFYHQKPVELSTVGTIWQYVALLGPVAPSMAVEQTTEDDHDDEEEEDSVNNQDKEVGGKKQKVSWDHDLHLKFVHAVDRIGIKQATPKRILQLMGRQELKRSHIASHLQKYRKYLKRKDPSNQHRSSSCFWLHTTERPTVLNSGPKDILKKHKLELGIPDREGITDAQVPQPQASLRLPQMMNLEQINVDQQRRLLYDSYIKRRLSGVSNVGSIDPPDTAFPALQTILPNSLGNLTASPALSTSEGHGSYSVLIARNIHSMAENSRPQNLTQGSNYVGLQLHSHTGELGLIHGMPINVPFGNENVDLQQNQNQLHNNETRTLNEQYLASQRNTKSNVLDTIEDTSWETILSHLCDTE